MIDSLDMLRDIGILDDSDKRKEGEGRIHAAPPAELGPRPTW